MAKNKKSKISSQYPISANCPNCGSTTYRREKSEVIVAFMDDRVCQECETRYTPPTPAWARVVFLLFGLAAIAGGILLYWSNVTSERPFQKEMAVGAMLPVLGVIFLYKAFTKG